MFSILPYQQLQTFSNDYEKCQLFSNPTPKVDYDFLRESDGYIVNLYKKINPNSLRDAYNNETLRILNQLKKNIQPQYQIIRDFFGNEVYVQKRINEHQLVNATRKQIDVSKLKIQLVTKAFNDYDIQLLNDEELQISSERDSFYERFRFSYRLNNIAISGYEILEDSNIAVLKIKVFTEFKSNKKETTKKVEVEKPKENVNIKNNDEYIVDPFKDFFNILFDNINENCEVRKQSQEEEDNSINNQLKDNEKKRIENERRQEQAIIEADIKEQKRIETQHKEQERLERIEHKKQERLEQKKKARLEQEKKIRLEQEAKAREEKEFEEEKKRVELLINSYKKEQQKLEAKKVKAQKKAEEEYTLQKQKIQDAYDQMIQRQKKETEKIILAQKQAKIEEQRLIQKQKEEQEKLKKQQELRKIQIEAEKKMQEDRERLAKQAIENDSLNLKSLVETDDEDKSYDEDSEADNAEVQLSKTSSPILEDVEDAEMDRYRESLTKSPRSNSILEDL